MSRVTLNIDGSQYEVPSETADVAKAMFRDFMAEVKRINEENPPVPGRLDGPAQRLVAIAQKRYRQRLRALVVDGAEPVAGE